MAKLACDLCGEQHHEMAGCRAPMAPQRLTETVTRAFADAVSASVEELEARNESLLTACREAEWTLSNLMPALEAARANGIYFGCDPAGTLTNLRGAIVFATRKAR